MLRQYLNLPRAVYVLCLGTFINRAGTLVLPFLTIYLGDQRGLGRQFATQAMGLYGAGAIVGSLAGGYLADRWGRRTVMLGALLGGAGLILLFGTLTSRWSILVTLLAFSTVAEMYRPAASAMISDLVGPERRPQAFGLMYVAINLGFSVGPVVAGYLAEEHSFSWLFVGDAVTTSVFAGIILFAIRETAPRDEIVAPAGVGAGSAARVDAAASIGPARLEAIRYMTRDTALVVFCSSLFCFALIFGQSMSTLPLHMRDLGIGSRGYGKIIALNGLLITVGQLPLTALLSRFNRAGVLAMGAAVTGVGFGLTHLAAVPWHFAMTVAVWTLGEMMQAPFVQSVVGDLAPTHLRARYFGVSSMAFSAGFMFGPPLGGMVLEHLGSKTLWLSCVVAGLVAAALIVSVAGRLNRPLPDPAPPVSNS